MVAWRVTYKYTHLIGNVVENYAHLNSQCAYEYVPYKQRSAHRLSTRVQVRAVQTAQRTYAVNAHTSMRHTNSANAHMLSTRIQVRATETVQHLYAVNASTSTCRTNSATHICCQCAYEYACVLERISPLVAYGNSILAT